MGEREASILELVLWLRESVGSMLGSLFCVWFFGGVLRRLGVRRIVATWVGYALSMLWAVFIINPYGGLSSNFLALYGVSGVVWALLLSLGYRPPRRNEALGANRDGDEDETNGDGRAGRVLQRRKRTRLRNRQRKDFSCFDCGADVRFGASHCADCDAEFAYSNGFVTRAD